MDKIIKNYFNGKNGCSLRRGTPRFAASSKFEIRRRECSRDCNQIQSPLWAENTDGVLVSDPRMVDPGARMESEVSGPNVWLELNKKAETKVQGFITRNKVGILIKHSIQPSPFLTLKWEAYWKCCAGEVGLAADLPGGVQEEAGGGLPATHLHTKGELPPFFHPIPSSPWCHGGTLGTIIPLWWSPQLSVTLLESVCLC